jgi:hypothetical protein
VLTYEVIRLQHLQGAIMYNDAKACYDCIIENLANLTLLREGFPPEIAQLHAQTLQAFKLFIKHKLGLGPIPNTFTELEPILGSGQGATDSPARWGFISDVLIRAYNDLAMDATIYSPISAELSIKRSKHLSMIPVPYYYSRTIFR